MQRSPEAVLWRLWNDFATESRLPDLFVLRNNRVALHARKIDNRCVALRGYQIEVRRSVVQSLTRLDCVCVVLFQRCKLCW